MARRGREEPADRGDDTDPAGDPVAVAREIVLRMLDRRAHTRAELEQALRRRGVPDDAAAEVLQRFGEVGLVDDGDFAQQWVSGQQRRMRSRRVLRQELRTRGVDDEVIAEALTAVDDADEYEAAAAFAVKKVRSMGRLEPHVRYRRLAAALARRGFSADVVHRAVRQATGVEADEA